MQYADMRKVLQGARDAAGSMIGNGNTSGVRATSKFLLCLRDMGAHKSSREDLTFDFYFIFTEDIYASPVSAALPI